MWSSKQIGMIAAAIQYLPLRGEVDINRARLLVLLKQAVDSGAELIVLPEMCTSGYLFPDGEAIRPYCEERSGRTVEMFQSEATRNGVTICFGWPEIDKERDLLFNSAAICRPSGETLFYRKRLLFEVDETWSEPGDTDYPIWRSEGGLVCSVGICMDLNDDRFIEFLIKEEIRVVAFPTNWLEQGLSVWNYWAWRILESKACLVASNRYGTEDQTTFCGRSAVLDGRTLLGWTEATGDAVVLARIPEAPTPFNEDS